MTTATTLRVKRTTAGIPGIILSKKIGMARSRLSDIERGHTTASQNELARIDEALEELIRVKDAVHDLASTLGWPGLELI